MPKIHTRRKRKLKMFRSRKKSRSKRPKTFKSEESAKKYAESRGIKSYKLVDLQELNPNKKKIKIVVK
ncbi:hypothetical protein KY347_01995 [Candidatus Woesearchaeota archaeon]|nr:hypothetical protein [Candidatus Woesearchaeota archaeon]